MPRPAKKYPPRTGPRTESGILLRLTEAEHEELRAAAQREALPLGTWARSLLLRAARSTT